MSAESVHGASVTYRVLLEGSRLPGMPLDLLKVRLAEVLGIERALVERLLSHPSVAVRQGVDLEVARRCRDALVAAGARARHEPERPVSVPGLVEAEVRPASGPGFVTLEELVADAPPVFEEEEPATLELADVHPLQPGAATADAAAPAPVPGSPSPSPSTEAKPAAAVEMPPPFDEDPELEALHRDLKACSPIFTSAFDRRLQSTGYQRQRSFASGIAVALALVAGVGPLIAHRWVTSLFVAVVVFVVVEKLLGPKKDKAKTLSRVFFHDLGRSPRWKEPLFLLAVRRWLGANPRIEADVRTAILSDLEHELSTRRSPALEEVQARVAEIDAYEAAKASYSRKLEAARRFEGAQLALEELSRFAPGFSHPVTPTQVVFHPRIPGSGSLGFQLSVSRDHLLFVHALSPEGVGRVPIDCIERVTIESASKGFSPEAIVSKIFDAMAQKETPRVRIDFNIFIPVTSTRGSLSQYVGVSFEVLDSEWAVAGPAWEDFARRAHFSHAACPLCHSMSVGYERASTLVQMGLKESPGFIARCTSCKAKLELDLGRGAFVPRAPT
jgi:hypothetical protein